MKHYYENVPGLGNVALSHHAQEKAKAQSISDAQVHKVLFDGVDTPDHDSVWRELNKIRLVIITPTPFQGAKLVRTMYRVRPQAKAKRR